MSIAYQLRWLKPDEYTGPAKLLAYYCQKNEAQYANQPDFNEKHFQAAIKLALATLTEQSQNRTEQ